jgi:membrane fusion protein (multidrug efflux system)
MYFKNVIICSFAILFAVSCSKDKKKQSEEKRSSHTGDQRKRYLVSNQFVTDIQAKKNVEMRSRIGESSSIFM